MRKKYCRGTCLDTANIAKKDITDCCLQSGDAVAGQVVSHVQVLAQKSAKAAIAPVDGFEIIPMGLVSRLRWRGPEALWFGIE